MSYEQLIVLWFLLEVVLWVGFFFLEGFDFGVAMLYPIIGKDPKERRVMINSIGPTWDGNEVWLLTAGGAMFAAFPGWYSSLFSGIYLPLFLVLLGLIIRGVSFEYRALMPDDRWRDTFDWCSTIGSLIVALVFGIGFANMWRGMGIAGDPPHMTTGFWALFNWFGLLGGITLIALCLSHGATFLALKTDGAVRDKASSLLKKLSPITAVLVALMVILGNLIYPASDNPHLGTVGGVFTWVVGLISVVCIVFAGIMHNQPRVQKRENIAFVATGLSIATLFITIFIRIFGTLGFVPEAGTKFDMWVAASSNSTLTLMSFAALVGVPIVLLYTIWTYRVFRRRLSVKNMPPEPSEQSVPARAVTD